MLCYDRSHRLPSHVLLVSGLGLEAAGDLWPGQLLVDLVSGQLGSEEEQRTMAGVTRVIVAGNSLSASSRDSEFLKVGRVQTGPGCWPAMGGSYRTC